MTDPSSSAPVSPPIEAVLFDFGGVFIDSPFAAVSTAAVKHGYDVDELQAAIFGPYDADTDHPWHRLERGELSFADAREQISTLAQSNGLGELDPVVVLAELAGSGLVLRDFMVDAVRRFRDNGMKTGVITNNIAEFGSAWKGLLPIDELFDDVVDSSDVGVRKPDEAIYRLACERLSIDARSVLFVDDFQGNVDGAIRAGMNAICCGYSVESTRDALAEMFVLAGLGPSVS